MMVSPSGWERARRDADGAATTVSRYATRRTLGDGDAGGQPHVVPICYALTGDTLYFTIDEKPKRQSGARLKRLANLRENPFAALVVDRYDEDWSRLGWVMVRGRADILESGPEHDRAQATPARPLSPARRHEHRTPAGGRRAHRPRRKLGPAGRRVADLAASSPMAMAQPRAGRCRRLGVGSEEGGPVRAGPPIDPDRDRRAQFRPYWSAPGSSGRLAAAAPRRSRGSRRCRP